MQIISLLAVCTSSNAALAFKLILYNLSIIGHLRFQSEQYALPKICAKYIKRTKVFKTICPFFICVMQVLWLKSVSLFGTGIELCFRTEPQILVS